MIELDPYAVGTRPQYNAPKVNAVGHLQTNLAAKGDGSEDGSLQPTW
jgi:hypothetical protein